MAQKRPKKRMASEVKTYNLFTAFNPDGNLKAMTSIQHLEPDEEEDLEELKAKFQKSSKGKTSKGKVKGKNTRKARSKYADSSDEEDVHCLTSPARASNENIDLTNRDSPSPPPPPQFDDVTVKEIMWKNRNAAKVIQKLETRMRSYQMTKAQAAMDNIISPIMSSPTKIDVDAPVARDTITVKVRTREGLRRFENYSMNQTFEQIFSQLGETEGVDASRVRLTRKGDDVADLDTPRSIKLHVADILDYVIVAGTAPTILSYSLLDEEDYVFIKLRTAERSAETITRRIAKMDTFQAIFQEFARMKEKNIGNLRFSFDGDEVHPNSSPKELDMDEENVIDVEVS